MINPRPVAMRVKYLTEFNARNRAEGDALYLTLTIPLGG